MRAEFLSRLRWFLNAEGVDSESNIPDYLLADFLGGVLGGLSSVVRARDAKHPPDTAPPILRSDALGRVLFFAEQMLPKDVAVVRSRLLNFQDEQLVRNLLSAMKRESMGPDQLFARADQFAKDFRAMPYGSETLPIDVAVVHSWLCGYTAREREEKRI